MTHTSPDFVSPDFSLRKAVIAIGLGLLFSVFALAYFIGRQAYDQALTDVQSDSRVAAQLHAAILQSELDRHRATPVILADDAEVGAALRTASPQALAVVSQKLETLRRETGATVIYIIRSDGMAVAASNWSEPQSFIGNNYGSRHYFIDAVQKGSGQAFALGSVSKRPGLYLSRRVMQSERLIGVVVVKVEFPVLERRWAQMATPIYVTDADHRIILTTQEDMRFKASPPLLKGWLETVAAVPATQWQLHLHAATTPARNAAVVAVLMTVAFEVFAAFVLWVWWRRAQRRHMRAQAEDAYRHRLEQEVAQRTQTLTETNERLSQEIEDRLAAQARLNLLQADLVQANKLAQLGQVTAGVAHEINQPVATIRLLADNALKLTGEKVTENLAAIGRMCERIGLITGDLRNFSRKATTDTEPVSLAEVIEGSVLLTQSRLKAGGERLILPDTEPDLHVWGQRVRLEQVLVNLLQNAIEAIEGLPDGRVRLSVKVRDNEVHVSISDNGPGLPESVQKALFMPFTTTKAKGLGLGLVIAHDIVRDFGGRLSVESSPEAGACFTLVLREVQP